jgi:hypothetical protein
VTSGRRDKQIQVYDPAIAEKQAIVQKSAGQADKYVGSKKAGQNMPAGQGAASADGGRSISAARRQQQGTGGAAQHQGVGRPRHREDDGNSALVRAGYQQQHQQGQHNEQCQLEQQQEKMIAGPIASRLGPRSLAASDARFKLDRIHQSELVERQGAPGPMCFGPRIMGEPVPYYFQLARGARTYNGSTKPEDWLEDYSTAVNIAGGNLRWAV